MRGFMCERARCPLAYDKMCLHSRPMQHLQQAHTKNSPGRASDTDDEASGFFRLHADSLSMKCAACRKEAERGPLCSLYIINKTGWFGNWQSILTHARKVKFNRFSRALSHFVECFASRNTAW